MFFEKVGDTLKKWDIGTKTPVLLACSGGRDSMSLAQFFLLTGQKFGIAHCNFQLRNDESDGDEAFIASFAKENQIPLFLTTFKTASYAKNQKTSIQEAARQLRYEWLETIRKENEYHFIITGHHANDNIETVLINFSKGCGLKGLSGIPEINVHVLRPLLNVTRKEINDFVVAHNIPFREDSSNDKEIYTRNYIRKNMVPGLEKINPAFVENTIDFVTIIKESNILLNEYMDFLFKKHSKTKGETIYLALQSLREKSAFKTLLFHFLTKTHLSSQQLTDLYHCIQNRQTYKQFITETHRLILDRNTLLIQKTSSQIESIIQYTKIPNKILYGNYKISVRKMPISEMNLKKSQKFAFFDAKKIEMPLMIRPFKDGDYFYPFGMGKNKSPEKPGKKKVSKFFKDIKLNQIQKDNTPILFSGEKIIWVVGQRIDQRFAITSSTKEVICFTIVNEPNL